MENRLSKVLAASGVASRRGAEELIFDGRVKVNGKIVLVPQQKVNAATDKITVDGYPVKLEEEKVYLVINKPKGCLCSSKQVNRTPIVLDLIKDFDLRLFTIGRLDKDTEGLLLITNDGHFAQQVIHPSNSIHKEYLVKVNADINLEHLEEISKGTMVEGEFVKPVRVTKVRKGTVKIVVSDGRKREVRHLIEVAGLEVLELKRIRIGGLVLGDLPKGSWRHLTEGEKKAIFMGGAG